VERLRELKRRRQTTASVIIPFAPWCIPPATWAAIPAGVVTTVALEWCGVKPGWVYLLRDGDLTAAATPIGNTPAEAVEVFLHQQLEELRRVRGRVVKPAGKNKTRTLAAREAVARAKAQTPEPETPVTWSSCPACSAPVSVPAGEFTATCPRCGGGI
jgi:hypothetical protein